MRPTRKRLRKTLVSATIALLPLAVGAVASPVGSAENPSLDSVAPEALPFLETEVPAPALPEDPVEALIESTAQLSADLGFPQDPGPSIRAAGLSDEFAGHLALVVQGLADCTAITAAHYESLSIDQLSALARGDLAGLDPSDFADIRACSLDLWQLTVALKDAATTDSRAANQDVNAWPVLSLDASGDDRYDNDYLLLVDLAGNDVYNNNAGSNMVDPNFSPEGFPIPGVRGSGPAHGCQMAIGAPGVGGLTNGDCVPAAAVLLDLAGSDTYGVKESPDVDAVCGGSAVVRRMVTGGVGFLGAGFLVDVAGNDRYTGKTVALGAGHVFGVGVLTDLAGSDSYSVVRNGQGFSLIGDLGLLNDAAGNDRFNFYLPAGGVIDDQGVCDDRLRFQQGAANLVGVGILLNQGGNDTYVGGFSSDFETPVPALPTDRGGSQGFGNSGGVGVFIDTAGRDRYTIVNQTGDQGSPARGDGVVIPPGAQSTGLVGLCADV